MFWSSEIDYRAACREILLVCRGILLDAVTHVAAHKHEN